MNTLRPVSRKPGALQTLFVILAFLVILVLLFYFYLTESHDGRLDVRPEVTGGNSPVGAMQQAG